MTTLLDRLLWDRCYEVRRDYKITDLSPLWDAIAIDATNVARYHYEVSDQDFWDLTVDFPNLAPPFDNFWIETKAPKFVRTEQGLDASPNKGLRRWGAHFSAVALQDWYTAENIYNDAQSLVDVLNTFSEQEMQSVSEKMTAAAPINTPQLWKAFVKTLGIREQMAAMAAMRYTALQEAYKDIDKAKSVAEGRWSLHATLFGEDFRGRLVGPISTLVLSIERDGSVLSNTWICPYADGMSETEYRNQFEIDQETLSNFFPLLLAISFMHCKNVAREAHKPDAKLSRAHRRRHGRELVTFHTLQIEPMKKVIQTEGDVMHNGLQKALHICRGHFSEYGADYGKGKLFGKYEGRFWVPSHVRGSSEIGIADKEYAIKAPRKVEAA